MEYIRQTFKLRPGEERIAALLVGLMLFTAAGSAIGGNAIEALFFARFGVALLPYLYVLLGLTSFVTSLAISGLMGRIPRQRLFVSLPLITGMVLIVEWLVIPLDLSWFFAAMWLGMNIIRSLQSLLTWSLASAACDTRQAKRLFPLFSAGGILGTVLGGLATRPLAAWLHSQNLLLIWAGALFIAFGLGRALSSRLAAAPPASTRAQPPGILQEMQRGYKFVRQSTILQWVSYSAVLFSVCYFSLALPFSRGAAAQFPDADALAGFLGLFQGLNTAAALLASLFLANRLFARFGIMLMLLVLSLIYLTGFGILAFSAPFTILVAVRFIQIAWMEGVAATAWQAMFNVIPSQPRDQVRAFISGVPEQAGTLIAGLILVVGEQALRPQQLYWIGLGAAALLAYSLWRANQAYGRALVEALRAGQPHIFYSEEQPFGGFPTDAAAVSVAVNGLSDADTAVRRVSAEILGNLPVPEAATALVKALVDEDAPVRAAALKGLARAQATSALLEIAASLSDSEAEVRYQAVDSLHQLALYPRGIQANIEPLLADAHPLVRAHAAQVLLCTSDYPQAKDTLYAMVADADPQVRTHALNALGECGNAAAFHLVLSALEDGSPLVRAAAAAALVGIDPQAALDPLVQHLADDDASVRAALAQALGRIGPAVLEPLLAALENPDYEDGALLGLEVLPAYKAADQIRRYAKAAVKRTLHYHTLALNLAQEYGLALEQGLAPKRGLDIADDRGPINGGRINTDAKTGRIQLLAESLYHQSQSCGLNALRAVGLFTSPEAVAVVAENLRSPDPAQRANALETLEAIGEPEIIRPLLALWEAGPQAPAPLPASWLLDLLHDRYAWLRACAVLVGMESDHTEIRTALQVLAQSDPDSNVRSAAEKAVSGGTGMDHLATLSLMERVLFLRRVSLFADLSPADLKQVAAVAGEAVFADGETLGQQDELGDEMYIVVSGQVGVLVISENHPHGHEVARRLPGDYVGEMSIISREPRIATMVAVGPVRTLCLNQKQFESLLRERPEIGLAVMQVLCQRLKDVTQSLAQQTHSPEKPRRRQVRPSHARRRTSGKIPVEGET